MADRRRLTRQLLWLMFNRRRFLMDFAERMRSDYFGSNEAKYLARLSLEYWEKDKALLPESAVFDQIDADSEEAKLEQYGVAADALDALWDSLGDVADEDLDYVWKATDDFIRRQGLGIAFKEALETLEEEGPEEALAVVDTARSMVEPKPQRTAKVFGGMNEMLNRLRVKEADGRYVSTGLPRLDRALGGGVLPGELAAFIAPTGRGKTMWLCHLAAKAFMLGARVLYYTLEIDQDEIALRTMSAVSGVAINDMKLWAVYGHDASMQSSDGRETPEERLEAMFTRIRRIGGRNRDIDVIDLSSATVALIHADIQRRKREGQDPNLIIIDYADRLTPRVNRDKQEHMELEIFRDLVGLAKEEQVAVWTAIQGNRQSLGKKVLDLKQIAGAYAKAWEATFVIAAGQTDKMMKRNQFTFGLAKVRRVAAEAKTGNLMDVFYEFSTSTFKDWLRPEDEDDDHTAAALSHVEAIMSDDDDEEGFSGSV